MLCGIFLPPPLILLVLRWQMVQPIIDFILVR